MFPKAIIALFTVFAIVILSEGIEGGPTHAPTRPSFRQKRSTSANINSSTSLNSTQVENQLIQLLKVTQYLNSSLTPQIQQLVSALQSCLNSSSNTTTTPTNSTNNSTTTPPTLCQVIQNLTSQLNATNAVTNLETFLSNLPQQLNQTISGLSANLTQQLQNSTQQIQASVQKLQQNLQNVETYLNNGVANLTQSLQSSVTALEAFLDAELVLLEMADIFNPSEVAAIQSLMGQINSGALNQQLANLLTSSQGLLSGQNLLQVLSGLQSQLASSQQANNAALQSQLNTTIQGISSSFTNLENLFQG